MTTKAGGQKILIVDDDKDILSLLRTWLSAEGFEVVTAESGDQAMTRFNASQPRAVVTDLRMEGMSGLDLLSEIHKDNPLLPVILFSGQAQIPDAVKAMHMGSVAFLTKPVDRDELLASVRRALDLTPDFARSEEIFSKAMLYQSAAMNSIVELARLVAKSDVTVFISGATGTGKEVIAKAIHNASARREAPFIAVNCAAIPEQLLESELFGHEKGAFTGANSRYEGLFKAADGGTLFLDEIGDMPLPLQVKLLRVLEEFAVRPVGSTRAVPINVRIISATHRDLEQAVEQGQFRTDLYYRLKVVPIRMPPLNERREDIPLLVNHFLQRYAERNKSELKSFAPDAMDFLVTSSWPGNIRQLNNVVELCATLCRTRNIPLSLARSALEDRRGEVQTLKEARSAFERNYLVSVLRIVNGRVTDAARIAGRNRTEFYKLLGQHGIDPSDFRENNHNEAQE